ncbi:LexA family transcriptional regulator [Desulfovibrio oxyclinae]|jgi:phage repressor protein C with HTH and peptisase S24 domain|uniref:LexA family transcriptional regulator n=1 Tax=Desulfovibrio oxyclinae TaxID=63560 RepID=UPI0003824816|nr:helix-turn-helix transcriptional regulator [Desulfovibrio oxyclinae]
MSKQFEAFFERLKQATDIRNQSDLARALDVGRAAVSLAKKKDQVPSRWVLALSIRYDVDARWLETGDGSATGEDDEAFERIPKVRARLSAGGGSFETEGQVEGYYSFRADWLHSRGNPRKMVLMEVVGNSMEPELKEGDLVLLDQDKTEILAGGLYAVGVEDTVMVKRVERLPRTLVLHSDNKDYSPVKLTGEELDNVRVIGRVLWVAREYM